MLASKLYAGFFGNANEANDLTKYRHKIFNNSVVFGTPVACEYDLSCYDTDWKSDK